MSEQEELGQIRFGVALFSDWENGEDPGEAWASVEGGWASRVSSYDELETDVIWWTNLTFGATHDSRDLWFNTKIKCDQYMGFTLKAAMQEWGLDPKTVGADHAAAVLSSVFGRVMNIAFRLIKDVNPRARMDQVFEGRFLCDDMLRHVFSDMEFSMRSCSHFLWADYIDTTYPDTSVRGIRGAKMFTLRKPRLAYAHEILQTPIPKGPWEFMSKRDLQSRYQDPVKWLCETNNPCIAEIAIHKIDGDIAPVYGFGNATDQDRRVARNWVAHPELLVLSRFAEIDVKTVWVGKEYEALGPKLPEAVKEFMQDKYSEFSWSAGVVAETLWRAGALGEEKGRGGDNGERAQTSWQGAWLKAADKSSMFLTAMQLTDKGYSVKSYGIGWVRVMITDDAINDLIRDGLSIGLMPQLVDVPEGMHDINKALASWGGDPKSEFLARMTVAGSRNMLWNMDKLTLLPDDRFH